MTDTERKEPPVFQESKIDDGGQAFPVPADDKAGWHSQEGMSLRDWFAGLAMQGFCAHPDNWGLTPKTMGKTAYEIADAMIAARKSSTAAPAATPVASADDWIQWHGGSCPENGSTTVEVKLRDGDVLLRPADYFGWKHGLGNRDIVAYRLVAKGGAR